MLQTRCLLAPADDRNALATPAGGIVLAVSICTLKPILAATPARSISLPRPATVNGALDQPADDRNALATTAGGIVLAVCGCTLKPILAATSARSISLPRPAIVKGAPLSETKVKADLASRFSVPAPANSSPSSRKVTPSHHLLRIKRC